MLLPSLSRFATVGSTFATLIFTTVVTSITTTVVLSQIIWPISTNTLTIHPSMTPIQPL